MMFYDYDKLHKLDEGRIMYASYVLDDNIPIRELIKEVGKTIDKDEFDTIVKICPKYIIRRNHNLFTYDDIATKLAKEENLALAKKVLLMFEKRCKIGGADYAYLAQRVYKITNDIRWCKRLFLKAKMYAEYEICYINMLNFIKLKIINQNTAIRFLNEILATTNFDANFYCYFGLEILSLKIKDAYAIAKRFYNRALKNNKSLYTRHIKGGLKHRLVDRPLACALLDQNIINKDCIWDLMAIAKICHKNENIGKKAVKKAIGLVKNTDDFVKIAPMAKKFLGKKETIKFLKQGYFLDETPLDDNENYSCRSDIINGKATIYYKASHINTQKVNILEWMIKLGKRSWAKRRLDEMVVKKDILKGTNIYSLAGAMAKVCVRYFNDTKSAEDIFKKVAQNINDPIDLNLLTSEISSTIGIKHWLRTHCNRLEQVAKSADEFTELAEYMTNYFLDFKAAQRLHLKAIKTLEYTAVSYNYHDLYMLMEQFCKNASTGILRMACQSIQKSGCEHWGLLANYYAKANDKVSAKSCFLKELNSAKSYQEILSIAEDIYSCLNDSEWVAQIVLDDQFLALPDSVAE
jgi:hypothetical protein